MKIKYESNNSDAWVCSCGNTPHDDGFFPCHYRTGAEVDPTPERWDGESYVCGCCGNIINSVSLVVTGKAV